MKTVKCIFNTYNCIRLVNIEYILEIRINEVAKKKKNEKCSLSNSFYYSTTNFYSNNLLRVVKIRFIFCNNLKIISLKSRLFNKFCSEQHKLQCFI